jgi:hypothetical protein
MFGRSSRAAGIRQVQKNLDRHLARLDLLEKLLHPHVIDGSETARYSPASLFHLVRKEVAVATRLDTTMS